MDAKGFDTYVRHYMRLILLLSALLSAIAGYTPAAAARPVEAGQVLCIAQVSETTATARPANTATPAKAFVRAGTAPRHEGRPLYADRLLI